ncbi:uncharacterized protein AMSG_00504 [Thecamonas trahens ATCC 50062]|uniref:Uncharacterized protein n=1 Tax=Thecamonas trahens ATCC 50062 TaxID=461836 RepID=A0A0L0D8R5_THETB|nr:hypothetical protein AMSG_00504 [Thecamonas trahens ATCC 50062]KNC48729.1 hypothetical protein AMSG_00504 [Thecamonas trahens ATCC 50062]|eukprot:XP_013762781.1 hypothetical protein AMSG_00504 [Thecamonas trahens ATCC 50062]
MSSLEARVHGSSSPQRALSAELESLEARIRARRARHEQQRELWNLSLREYARASSALPPARSVGRGGTEFRSRPASSLPPPALRAGAERGTVREEAPPAVTASVPPPEAAMCIGRPVGPGTVALSPPPVALADASGSQTRVAAVMAARRAAREAAAAAARSSVEPEPESEPLIEPAMAPVRQAPQMAPASPIAAVPSSPGMWRVETERGGQRPRSQSPGGDAEALVETSMRMAALRAQSSSPSGGQGSDGAPGGVGTPGGFEAEATRWSNRTGAYVTTPHTRVVGVTPDVVLAAELPNEPGASSALRPNDVHMFVAFKATVHEMTRAVPPRYERVAWKTKASGKHLVLRRGWPRQLVLHIAERGMGSDAVFVSDVLAVYISTSPVAHSGAPLPIVKSEPSPDGRYLRVHADWPPALDAELGLDELSSKGERKMLFAFVHLSLGPAVGEVLELETPLVAKVYAQSSKRVKYNWKKPASYVVDPYDRMIASEQVTLQRYVVSVAFDDGSPEGGRIRAVAWDES